MIILSVVLIYEMVPANQTSNVKKNNNYDSYGFF